MRIIETDNYGNDYPSESFLNIPPTPKKAAPTIAKAINDAFHANFSRHWKVIPNDYIPQPGFEP